MEEYILHNTEQLDKLIAATNEYKRRVQEAGVYIMGFPDMGRYHIDDVRNFVDNPKTTIVTPVSIDWPIKRTFEYKGILFLSRHQS